MSGQVADTKQKTKLKALADNPKLVRCPCLNCGFVVWFDYGPREVRLDEKQALDKLIQHLKKDHTVGELFEWLERCAVEYFDREVGV